MLLRIFLICCTPFLIMPIDWRYYLRRYKDLEQLQHSGNPGLAALIHFKDNGIYEGRKCAPDFDNTNFDWKYYIEKNNLKGIGNARAAKHHYDQKGQYTHLEYCKRFKICILFHLYNLNLMEEFISRINHFIKINDLNDFCIKITIPIASNFNEFNFNALHQVSTNTISRDVIFQAVLQNTPHHKHLVNQNNFEQLHKLTEYLKKRIDIKNIQIIFCENRGMDIGGFFLGLDQIIRENLDIDYIIKIHTKSSFYTWRITLLSILNIHINTLLRTRSFIYTCDMPFKWSGGMTNYIQKLSDIFKLPRRNFSFCAGTMFIAPKEFVDFFRPHNLLTLYQSLNVFTSHPSREYIEHAYERFFGYVANHLRLKTQIIGYIPNPVDRLSRYHNENETIEEFIKLFENINMTS